MTVMSDHAVRLSESASLLVLDPTLGPTLRAVSALALGDEVLVVAGGRMCFRRIMSADEAVAPEAVTQIPAGSLGSDTPTRAMTLDSRQPIGTRSSLAPLSPAHMVGGSPTTPIPSYWLDVIAEGAERVIVENVTVGTGSLPEPAAARLPVDLAAPSRNQPAIHPLPVSAKSIDEITSGQIPPVRAFNGPVELTLASASLEDATPVYRFVLPPRTTTLRLSSPSMQPPGDGRKLGVAILKMAIESNEIPLDSPALVRGFHRAETREGETWRWTDGEALLIFPPKPVPQTFSISITNWHRMFETPIAET